MTVPLPIGVFSGASSSPRRRGDDSAKPRAPPILERIRLGTVHIETGLELGCARCTVTREGTVVSCFLRVPGTTRYRVTGTAEGLCCLWHVRLICHILLSRNKSLRRATLACVQIPPLGQQIVASRSGFSNYACCMLKTWTNLGRLQPPLSRSARTPTGPSKTPPGMIVCICGYVEGQRCILVNIALGLR